MAYGTQIDETLQRMPTPDFWASHGLSWAVYFRRMMCQAAMVMPTRLSTTRTAKITSILTVASMVGLGPRGLMIGDGFEDFQQIRCEGFPGGRNVHARAHHFFGAIFRLAMTP